MSFSKLRWDVEARSGGPLRHPGPCAPRSLRPALRLRPLAGLGRRENTATRLEGPTGSDVDTAAHARVESWNVDQSSINPENHFHLRARAIGAAAGQHRGRAGPSPAAPRPPRTLGFPLPSGHRTLHCEAAAPYPQTEHLLPLSSPKTSQIYPRASQTSLHGSPRCPAPRQRPEARPPLRTSSLPGRSAARLPFLLLVSCHRRRGPCRRRARWELQPLPSRGPSRTPRGPPVRTLLSARRPGSRAQPGDCLRAAGAVRDGEWRKVTGRNLHREAGSGTGVGGGCQTPKRGQSGGHRRPFFPRRRLPRNRGGPDAHREESPGRGLRGPYSLRTLPRIVRPAQGAGRERSGRRSSAAGRSRRSGCPGCPPLLKTPAAHAGEARRVRGGGRGGRCERPRPRGPGGPLVPANVEAPLPGPRPAPRPAPAPPRPAHPASSPRGCRSCL